MDGEKQKTKRGKQKNRMFSQRAALVQMYRDGISPTQMRERLGFHDISKATFSRHMKTILAEDLPMLSAQVAFSMAQGAYGKQSYAPPPVASPVSQPKPEPEPAQQEDRKRSTAAKQSAGDDEPYDVLLRMKESGTKAGW